jgi:hypothetical protein
MNGDDRLPIQQLVFGVHVGQGLAFLTYFLVHRILKCDESLGDGLQYGLSLGRRNSELLIGSDTSYSAKTISPVSFDLEVHHRISTPMMYESSQRQTER